MWSREIDELGMINLSEKGLTCSRVFKIVLVGFMIGLVIAGVAVLGIGIWAHESEYGSKAVGGLIGVALYSIDSTMFIACGTVLICIMAVGLIGYLMPQKCLLGLHLCVMTFLAFTLFAAGILGYVFVGELEDTVRGSLKKSVSESYGTPGEGSLTKAWDDIQQAFECCGGYGGENDTTSWYLYQSDSFWFNEGYNNNATVPQSCCDPKGNVEQCIGKQGNTDVQNMPPYHSPPVIEKPTNYTIYLVGCYDKLEKYLERNGILIGTTAVVVGVFMLCEIAMTIFVYRSLH